jgi:hypothetical protein
MAGTPEDPKNTRPYFRGPLVSLLAPGGPPLHTSIFA